MKKLIAAMILSCALVAPLAFAEDGTGTVLEGVWSGRLAVGKASLRIVFHVARSGDSLKAVMDSPDQGAYGIPVASAAIEGGKATFDVAAIRASFSGTPDAAGDKIVGAWKQGGANLPLTLERQDPSAAQARGSGAADGAAAQTAAPGAAAKNETSSPVAIEISFPDAAAGITLSGTFLVPAGKGPFPAAILVTGSGPQNRDEELVGHKPFLELAEYLASRGIATLRYDDRGVGASGGDFASATTYDFAADARSALACLARRPEADPSRLGIIGHSEGGLIAALVGSSDPEASFAVMLAGPGLKGDKLLLAQTEAICRASGLDEKATANAVAINGKLYGIAGGPGNDAEKRAEIVAALKDSAPGTDANGAADQLLSPWFKTFLSIDPAEPLSVMKIPVLAMNGSKDLQVPAEANLKAIGAALDTAGNSRYRLLELEGLNHLFQRATSGLPSEYASIPGAFAPEALAALGDWIVAATR